MKRDVGLKINVKKTIDVEDIAVTERIMSVVRNFENKEVHVDTNLLNSHGTIIKQEQYTFSEEEYTSFLNNGEVISEEAIWKCIDTLR